MNAVKLAAFLELSYLNDSFPSLQGKRPSITIIEIKSEKTICLSHHLNKRAMTPNTTARQSAIRAQAANQNVLKQNNHATKQ